MRKPILIGSPALLILWLTLMNGLIPKTETILPKIENQSREEGFRILLYS